MKNVVLFGGAFDPIHNGHLDVANFVLNELKFIDEIWLMPTYHHMYDKSTVNGEHRLNMCRLAIGDNPKIIVFDFEILNKLHGETYYTIKKLLDSNEYKNINFYFLMGLDNANTFHKWFKYDELKGLISFIVLPRENYEKQDNAWYTKSPHIFLKNFKDVSMLSSTLIRQLLNNGIFTNNEFVYSKFIKKEVLSYIINNGLYANK